MPNPAISLLAGLHMIRAHRLWERYLADETGLAEIDWHAAAEAREHHLTPAEVGVLESHLGYPNHDPHGDPIPPAEGGLRPHGGRPLAGLQAGERGRIVHLEDEPASVYAELVAEELAPGMLVQVIESNPSRIRFWANGDPHTLSPLSAGHVAVLLTAEAPSIEGGTRLAALTSGEEGEVLKITPACRGAERRRMMDLGILPGTRIGVEFASPAGSPIAYRIRGAVIALRQEQAEQIIVRRPGETP